MNIEFDQIENLSINNQSVKTMYLNGEKVFPPVDSNTVWFDFASQYQTQELGQIIYIAKDTAFMKDGAWGTDSTYWVHIHAKGDTTKRGVGMKPTRDLGSQYVSMGECKVRCFYRPVDDKVYIVYHGWANASSVKYFFMVIFDEDGNKIMPSGYMSLSTSVTSYWSEVGYSVEDDAFVHCASQYSTYIIGHIYNMRTGTASSVNYTNPSGTPYRGINGMVCAGNYVVIRHRISTSYHACVYELTKADILIDQGSVGLNAANAWDIIGHNGGFLLTASNLWGLPNTWNSRSSTTLFMQHGEVGDSTDTKQFICFLTVAAGSHEARKAFFRLDFDNSYYTLVSKLDEAVTGTIIMSDDKNLWADTGSVGKVRYFRPFKGGTVYS